MAAIFKIATLFKKNNTFLSSRMPSVGDAWFKFGTCTVLALQIRCSTLAIFKFRNGSHFQDGGFVHWKITFLISIIPLVGDAGFKFDMCTVFVLQMRRNTLAKFKFRNGGHFQDGGLYWKITFHGAGPILTPGPWF